MEDIEWKRDETPYLIFACYKCFQYSYVKTTQKTKRCLRCGHTHNVKNLLNKSEIINGMTNAVNRIKHLQHEFSRQELKGEPDFATEGGFKITSYKESDVSIVLPKNEDEDEQLYDLFILMLRELTEMYKTFPKYIIELMAENKHIPQSELANLMRRALKEGYLMNHNEDYILKRT